MHVKSIATEVRALSLGTGVVLTLEPGAAVELPDGHAVPHVPWLVEVVTLRAGAAVDDGAVIVSPRAAEPRAGVDVAAVERWIDEADAEG